MKTAITLSALLTILSIFPIAAQTTPPKREFRGAWMQCVNGAYLNKSPEQIQTMLTEQLDCLQDCGINAVLFQVRPECDALYSSTIEPWSRFLTGQQGTPPIIDGQIWDPLQWMITQCHQRGMELHAWINPYRAKTKATNSLATTHYAIQHPDRILNYDGLLILNPALKENRLHTLIVVEDILNRYDIDGLHIDDYFYPYPVAGLPIPDQDYFVADPRGFTNIDDWRRDNVNQLIHQLHQLIRATKPWVKFGVSPFGIYRNNTTMENTHQGSATKGTQNYSDLYADILLWQQKGWVDYLIPQVYWNIGTPAADYTILLNWWNDYCHNRPLYIGQDIERTVKGIDPTDPTHHQQQAKYTLQRSLPNIQGSCQWYAAALLQNPANYTTTLRTNYHSTPALQPRMPFIDKKAPAKVTSPRITTTTEGITLQWNAPKAKKELDRAIQYVIYDFPKGTKPNTDDPTHIFAITPDTHILLQGAFAGHTLLITALDRLHNESKPIKIQL